jgi:hypothetical protein
VGREDPGRLICDVAAVSAETIFVPDDHCQCRGVCAREHTGPCPNRLGMLAAGSRHPVRLTLVGDRLLCVGCQEPFDRNKRWRW